MIGIIDSGTGGMNVVAECLKYYNEDFVYLLDNKNCPYGNKRVDELKQILVSHINYLIKNFDLDLIIIACNTISSLIDYSLLLNFKTPILKTVPEVKNIKNNGENVLIFATKNTLKNSKEIKLLKYNYKNIKTLQIKGLPKVIDNYLIEKTSENKQNLKNLLNNYFLKEFKINLKIKNKKLKPLQKNILSKKYQNVEYISLGCTHFKHIKNLIKTSFNGKVKFFECEKAVAKNSKWLIRKSKKQSTLNLILTQPSPELEKTVYKMFDELAQNIVQF